MTFEADSISCTTLRLFFKFDNYSPKQGRDDFLHSMCVRPGWLRRFEESATYFLIAIQFIHFWQEDLFFWAKTTKITPWKCTC